MSLEVFLYGRFASSARLDKNGTRHRTHLLVQKKDVLVGDCQRGTVQQPLWPSVQPLDEARGIFVADLEEAPGPAGLHGREVDNV